ncbi:alpha-E domain-containing protein [Candidatus Palauibacter sp.]|uniref:alpha-E domain-containing protein n=1 Tax=Candidatus Palauibacter sp. TaxID=3101350 RepID=UPI003B02E1AD
MLARMAGNFYWLGRYAERTENTARLLEHQLGRLVDAGADELAVGWRVVYRALSQAPPEAPTDVDEAEAFLIADAYTLAGGLVEDTMNPASMVSCWGMARENAREIRPRLPLRVWVCLNRGFLWIEATEFADVWARGPVALVTEAIDRLRLLSGVVDASMARDDAWRFLELGRYVERLQQQIVLLDVWDRIGRPGSEGPEMSWADLLRVCGAFEPYRRDRSLALDREDVLGFLIRNPGVARSLRFATDRIGGLLRGIDPIGARHPLAAPHRMVLRMAASIEVEDVSGFEGLIRESWELHEVLMATYVEYPVTAGLPS